MAYYVPLSRDTQRDTSPFHHILVLCSRVEIPLLTLNQICGMQIPGNYKLFYSKAQKLFCSTKYSMFLSWSPGTRLHELHLTIRCLESIGSSFTQWASCLRETRTVPEQRPLSWIPEDFIQHAIDHLRSDLRYGDTRCNTRYLSCLLGFILLALLHSVLTLTWSQHCSRGMRDKGLALNSSLDCASACFRRQRGSLPSSCHFALG